MSRKSNKNKNVRFSLSLRLRNYFITGVLVAAPIGVTIALSIIILNFIADLVPGTFNLNKYLPVGYTIPGLEIISQAALAIIFLTFLGMLTVTFFGRAILVFGEKVLDHVPFIRNVYRAVKQLTEIFSTGDKNFQNVVLIEYPRKGIWAIGFMTGDTKGEIGKKKDSNLVNVFVPTTPNPTSGFLLFFPKEDVLTLDMSVEDALKLVVSAGMVVPPHH